jgi:predicted phage tail protein
LWDVYANGKALTLGSENTLASLGFGYLVTAHYTQTGLPDLTPAAPTNLDGAVWFTGSSYVVNLTFADNASNEFWIDVERCIGFDCTNFSKVGQTRGENSTGFRDTDVARGTTYTYRVRAVGFMGSSAYSNSVAVTLPPADPSTTPPLAPSNLVATAFSKSQISLSWINSGSQDGVKIERCAGSGCTNFSEIAVLTGSATFYTNAGLAAGTTYRYRLRAYNSAGNSPYSTIAAAKTSRR